MKPLGFIAALSGSFCLAVSLQGHEVKRRLLPEDDRDFALPQKGKTILVRAPKSKKNLHKITWSGEKFVEQK